MTDREIVEKFEQFYSNTGGSATNLQVTPGQRLVELARLGLARQPDDPSSARVVLAVGHIAGTASRHHVIAESVDEFDSEERAMSSIAAHPYITHAAIVVAHLPPIRFPRVEAEVQR